MPAAAAHPRPVTPGPDTVFTFPALDTFGDVLARPLFWASRRPMTASEGPAAAPSDLTLLGVISARDGTVALVRHGKPAHVDRIREGAVLDGWAVTEIAASRVVLERGQTRAELKPKAAPPPAPTALDTTKPPQVTPPSPPTH